MLGLAVTLCGFVLAVAAAWIGVTVSFSFMGTLEVTMAFDSAIRCVGKHAALGGSVALIRASGDPA